MSNSAACHSDKFHSSDYHYTDYFIAQICIQRGVNMVSANRMKVILLEHHLARCNYSEFILLIVILLTFNSYDCHITEYHFSEWHYSH